MTALRTARLRLRLVQEADVPAIVDGCEDLEVARFIPVIPSPYTSEDARDWLKDAAGRWAAGRECSFALTRPDADELLGVVTVRVRDGGSIGYWLHRRVRGEGLMSEAVRAVAEWAAREHGVSDLFITAHPENYASQRVAERAGFVRVGVVEHDPPFRDGTREAVRFEKPSRRAPAVGQALSRGAPVEQLVFGTQDPGMIDELVDELCMNELGSPVAETLFRATSVGLVFGLRLGDGRRVVVKAHQPRESSERLDAVQSIQSVLFRAGFPCPEPLAGPTAIGRGLAVVESLIDAGEFRDTHDPTCRRLIANAFAWHLELTRAFGCPSALAGAWTMYASDRLWPRDAHAPIFDFDATASGAEWIDDIAKRAKPLAAQLGRLIVGHSDWSGKHFRFGEEAITVVYDWDSLRLEREAVLVGVAAMTFTTNFDLPGLKLAPAPDEVRAFVDDYSAARPTALTRGEREQIAACATFIAAYIARCEHCGYRGYDAASDRNSFTWALREHGLGYLTA